MRLWSRQKLSEKQPPYLFWFRRILAKLKQTIGILKKSPFSRNSVTKKKIVSIPFLCACKNLQACTLILPLSLLRTKANSALNIFVFARGRSTLIAYMIRLKKKIVKTSKKVLTRTVLSLWHWTSFIGHRCSILFIIGHILENRKKFTSKFWCCAV